MVPLSLPALGAIAIILFLATWNNYLWPLIAANNMEILTLPLGLSWLISPSAVQDMKGPQWQLALVASTISILPLLVTFVLAQKQFIAGLTAGGVKGV